MQGNPAIHRVPAPPLFSNRDLLYLIFPLVVEQLLTLLVGLIDTMMVSQVGEAAVSGVSMVDMINGVFNVSFTALATGGAVIVSQYIGNRDRQKGCHTASQLITLAVLASVAIMAACLPAHRQILGLLFGSVEAGVMEASTTYFSVMLLSYPFAAVYSACAALFRAMGKSKVTMLVSLLMNAVNVGGNAIAIFALGSGVAGVAAASLLARALAAAVMLLLCLNRENLIFIRPKAVFAWQAQTIRRLLRVAAPSCISSVLFQITRVLMVGIIALFGTTQIAANGVANSMDYLCELFGSAMNFAMMTVVGRCVGANDYRQAGDFIRKLLKITYAGSLVIVSAITALCPLILRLYAVSEETRSLAFTLILIHNVLLVTVNPLTVAMAGALRAAGDVRYTMAVAIVASVVCRPLLAVVFGIWLDLRIVGIWIAMGLDWIIRASLHFARYKSGKWQRFRLV